MSFTPLHRLFISVIAGIAAIAIRPCSACIICEQGPDEATRQQWLQQRHKTVQIVYANGKPLAGVRVGLQNLPEPLQETRETTATFARGPGLFSYAADPQSTQLLVFSKDGYASIAHRVAETLPRQITLPRERILTGTVVTADGKPVRDATVGPLRIPDPHADHSDGRPPIVYPHIVARTDNNGNFQAGSLQDTGYSFDVRAHGFCTTNIKARAGEPIRILLAENGTSITGRLIGSRDRQPLTHRIIEARAGELREYVRTGADGRFAFEYLDTQSWTFTAWSPAKGLLHSAETVDLSTASRKPPAPIELVYNQGASLEGIIVDGETSIPVQGLALIIEEPEPVHALSDSSGKFRFPCINGLADISLRHDASQYATVDGGTIGSTVRVPHNNGADLSTVTLQVYRQVRIAGDVIRPDGSPAVQATVYLRPFKEQETEVQDSSTRTKQTYTDENGKFTFGVYPAGPYRIWATGSDSRSHVTTCTASSTNTAIVRLALLPALSIQGIVQSPEGKPLPNAKAEAFQGANCQAGPVSSATSDLQGRFLLNDLLPERVKLVATHAEFALPAQLEVDPADADRQPVELRFVDGHTLILQVQSTDTTAIPHAKVQGSCEIAGKKFDFSAETSAGVVSIRGLPAPEVTSLELTSSDYLPHHVLNFAANSTTQTVALTRRPSVLLSFSGSGTALPAQDAVLYLFRRSDIGDYRLTERQSTASAEPVLFDKLEPGNFKAALRLGFEYQESEPFDLQPGQQKHVEMTPGQRQLIEGIVRDAITRAPVQGAIITIAPPQNQLIQAARKYAASSTDGVFFLQAAPGEMLLRVSHTGYPVWSRLVHVTKGQPAVIEVSLSSHTIRLHGTISCDGRPVANTLLVLTATSSQEVPYLSAMSAADGTWEMQSVQPGDYVLGVEAPMTEDDRAGHRTLPMKLSEQDKDRRVDVAFKQPIRVKGRIQGSTGTSAPAPLEHVVFQPRFEGGVAQLAAIHSGLFELQLEPGTYSASVADHAPQAVRIPDIPGRVVEITLTR